MTPTPAFYATLQALVLAHRWWMLAAVIGAVAIGGIIRILKSPAPFPTWLEWMKIPARARPWVATLLGIVGGALSAAIAGQPVLPAVLTGVMSAFTAIAGHEMVVESLRGGVELFTKSNKSPPQDPTQLAPAEVKPPANPTPPATPPTASPRWSILRAAAACFVFFYVVAVALIACSKTPPPNAPNDTDITNFAAASAVCEAEEATDVSGCRANRTACKARIDACRALARKTYHMPEPSDGGVSE